MSFVWGLTPVVRPTQDLLRKERKTVQASAAEIAAVSGNSNFGV
jgi:hypothetical protein